MKKNKFVKLPLEFSKVDYNSDRFEKLRVKVMHNGLNLNNSNFSDGSIERASGTLQNVPILAFVKKTDGAEDADFSGHEIEIKLTEDGVKQVYLGRPIGMIPETNNYTYEEDEDGKKFVYVDGYIWKDYANEALDIIQKAGQKKVSMEIKVYDYDFTEDYMDILDYAYTGIALLGDDVREAMIGAKAEIMEFQQETFSKFVLEFKNAFTAAQEEDQAAAATESEVEPFEEEVAKEESIEKTAEEAFEEETPIDKAKEEIEQLQAEEEPVEPEVEPAAEPEVEEIDPVELENLTKRIAELEEKIGALESENHSLKEFKAAKEKEEFDSKVEILVSDFEDLEEEEIKEAIGENFTLAQIEVNLYAARGKKTKNIKNKTKMFNISDGGIYSRNDTQEPVWAALVKKHTKN